MEDVLFLKQKVKGLEYLNSKCYICPYSNTVRHNLIIHSSSKAKLNAYICLNEQHAVNILGFWGKGSTHS